jgi:hypothetical protein
VLHVADCASATESGLQGAPAAHLQHTHQAAAEPPQGKGASSATDAGKDQARHRVLSYVSPGCGEVSSGHWSRINARDCARAASSLAVAYGSACRVESGCTRARRALSSHGTLATLSHIARQRQSRIASAPIGSHHSIVMPVHAIIHGPTLPSQLSSAALAPLQCSEQGSDPAARLQAMTAPASLLWLFVKLHLAGHPPATESHVA